MAYMLTPIATDSAATSQPQIKANFSYLSTILNPTVTAEEHIACFVGEIRMYGGMAATCPRGWIICDGSAYNRTNASYAGLFAVLSTRYGSGDGSTTFNVPSFANVFVRGVVDSPGTTGGADTCAVPSHTLTLTETPAHTHTLTTKSESGGTGATAGSTGAGSSGSQTTDSSGSDGAHGHSTVDTIPKYGTAIYLIKR